MQCKNIFVIKNFNTDYCGNQIIDKSQLRVKQVFEKKKIYI